MRSLKKISAVLLAVVMVMSLGVMTAFASTSSEDGKGSITITGANEQEEYYAYKMLDVTYDGNGNYSYTVTEEWAEFFNSVGLVWFNIDGNVATWRDDVEQSDENINAFAQAALDWAESNNITPTATQSGSSRLVFSDLDLGYYLINTSLGTVIMLDTTDPDAVIEDKNGQPTPDKTVEENSTGVYGETNDAGIGDTVNFEITISSIVGAEGLVLHDVMAEGLTLDGSSFAVYIDGVQIGSGSGYTVLTRQSDASQMADDECTFEIVFEDRLFTSDQVNEDSVITITYSATVNSDAVIGTDGNSNEVYLQFGEIPTYSETIETTTYVWAFNVYKYTTDDAGVESALAGAEFVLGTLIDGEENYAILDSDNKLVGWTTNQSTATVLTSPESGLIIIEGLDSGEYFLRETAAPDGFNALSDDIEVLIANESEDGAVSGTEVVLVDGAAYDAIKVLNNSGTELPSTGGMGTTIFYIVGGILIVGAAVILITRRRVSKDAE